MKNWLKLKSMRDIQVFLRFANFYWYFIQSFSRIARPLISILRTSPATQSSKNSLLLIDMAEVNEIGVGDGDDHEDKTIKRLLSKNLNKATSCQSSNARQAFTQLRQTFTKAPIPQNFDLKCYIWIQTDASDYSIGRILSQLTLDNLSQWDPVTYYSRKIILAKTHYKTYDGELLPIVEAFKTLQYYLENCKYKMLVLINHNNLCCFMDTKSLSSKQIHWAQELSRYYFWIDYYQNKANGAADALSRFF